ncbi:MAG: HPr family phosphocarrier protein [Kiritimatiellae bacterium]|nr:HPr family phosphocarrier protein [Kiritimatiellia bacterium]NLD89858.1 hypothetical protein [Lentisphaerota bacterium]
MRANVCAILELLKLGAAPGKALETTAEGPDEEAALRALSQLFDAGAGISRPWRLRGRPGARRPAGHRRTASRAGRLSERSAWECS